VARSQMGAGVGPAGAGMRGDLLRPTRGRMASEARRRAARAEARGERWVEWRRVVSSKIFMIFVSYFFVL
jgi:hypothetical protein